MGKSRSPLFEASTTDEKALVENESDSFVADILGAVGSFKALFCKIVQLEEKSNPGTLLSSDVQLNMTSLMFASKQPQLGCCLTTLFHNEDD